jgi:hypothetical protein
MLSEHSAFESKTQARERLDSYLRMLKRGDERNQVIADNLTECRRGQYCDCAACPICVQGLSVVMLELLYHKISAAVAWTQASYISNRNADSTRTIVPPKCRNLN